MIAYHVAGIIIDAGFFGLWYTVTLSGTLIPAVRLKIALVIGLSRSNGSFCPLRGKAVKGDAAARRPFPWHFRPSFSEDRGLSIGGMSGREKKVGSSNTHEPGSSGASLYLLVPLSPLPPSGEKRRITIPRQALVAYIYNFNVEVKSHVRKCLIPLLFSPLPLSLLSSPLPASFSATPGDPSILFLLYELDLTGRILSASPLRLSASYASKAKTRPVLGYPSYALKEHQPPLQTEAENYIASYDSQHCNPRRRVAPTIGQDHLRYPRRRAM